MLQEFIALMWVWVVLTVGLLGAYIVEVILKGDWNV